PPTAAQFEWCVQNYGAVERFKAGKNKGSPKPHKVEDTSRVQEKWGELIYRAPGIVDLGLLPKDVRESFEETFTGKRKLVDDSPVYSTGAECLEMLVNHSEFADETKDIIRALLKFALLD